jgi:hypothetical protein
MPAENASAAPVRNRNPAAIVRLERVERLDHFVVERRTHSVALIRSVERHPGDLLLELHEDVFSSRRPFGFDRHFRSFRSPRARGATFVDGAGGSPGGGRSSVGVHNHIHEAPRPLPDTCQCVIDAPQWKRACDDFAEIEDADTHHFGHQLGFAGGEPVGAAIL